VTQDVEQFYPNKGMADGRLNKCKSCARKDSIDFRNKNIKKYLEHDRKRAMLPHRVAQRKEYTQSEKGKLVKNGINKRYVAKFPYKKKATQAVNNAIRDKKLMRLPCVVCGNKAQAHHEDYSKPLDVIWYCPKHHKDRHRELEELGVKL
jgi:hypothetical protein